jgi:vacuolar-type H+-ATPase subunit F/Vma7
MKNIKWLTIALLMGIANLAAAQAESTNAIDKYFQQYVEDDRFTVVYISSKLMSMFEKLNIESMDMDDAETQAIIDLASDLEGIRILVAEENAAGFYQEAKTKIDTKEYEVLMTVRNADDQDVDFLIKDEGDLIHELLLLVGGSDQFVLLSFVGNIDMNKISKLINEFDEKEKPEEDEQKN